MPRCQPTPTGALYDRHPDLCRSIGRTRLGAGDPYDNLLFPSEDGRRIRPSPSRLGKCQTDRYGQTNSSAHFGEKILEQCLNIAPVVQIC